jgi:ribosomal protein L31
MGNLYSIMMQATPEDDTIYMSIYSDLNPLYTSLNLGEAKVFDTNEEAQALLDTLQSNQTDNRVYKIVSYEDNTNT